MRPSQAYSFDFCNELVICSDRDRGAFEQALPFDNNVELLHGISSKPEEFVMSNIRA
jgi:hypothetical protein